ncbi:cupin domain-containing protein [Streptomyces sp. LZ34]
MGRYDAGDPVLRRSGSAGVGRGSPARSGTDQAAPSVIFIPEDASVMTVVVEWPPGDPGAAPHRHSGPAFGYVIEGAVRFELEGEPERVVKAGGTFWEPGGDVIHYQDGNALPDASTKFVVNMICEPGQPMLIFVDEEELAQRAHLRAPRPSAG